MEPNGRPGAIYWIDHYTVCTNDLARFTAFHAQVLGGPQWTGPTGREVFQTVGLFDQELGFGEDSDWFDRARKRGLKLRQVDQVMLLITAP